MNSNVMWSKRFHSAMFEVIHHSRYIRFFTLVTLLTATVIQQSATAQSTLTFSGLGYLDYNYVLTSPDSGQAGANGFEYRRIYLTADYKISDTFSGRLRFEVSNSSTTAQGRPAPFVKDMYLRWNNIWGEGHTMTIGVSSPPSFTVSERAWGYRSLERTLMDRNRIVSSRDFGVVFKGPLSTNGALRYAFMFSNNEGVNQENDKNKRVYSQLEWYPLDPLTITVGLDYAKLDGQFESGINIPLFVGYSTPAFSLGFEAFVYGRDVSGTDENFSQSGVSFFGTYNVNETTTLIARADYVDRELLDTSFSDTFMILAVALRPHKNVRFIPNLLIEKDQRDNKAMLNSRITVHIDFK